MSHDTESQARAAYWKQHIEAWKLSGLSQIAFCNENDLPYHRFVYWRGKFGGSTRQKTPRSGFTSVNYRPESETGLSLSLPNGLVVRGICVDNLPVVRQLLDCL